MAESLNSIAERMKEEYYQESAEIQRTVATCDTCLLSTYCAQEYQIVGQIGNSCKDFVPETWKDHIHFNGEWWS